MIIEGALSVRNAGLSPEEFDRMTAVIRSIYPELEFPDIPSGLLEELIARDKKVQAGEVGYVLLKSLGEPLIRQKLPFPQVVDTLDLHKNP